MPQILQESESDTDSVCLLLTNVAFAESAQHMFDQVSFDVLEMVKQFPHRCFAVVWFGAMCLNNSKKISKTLRCKSMFKNKTQSQQYTG